MDLASISQSTIAFPQLPPFILPASQVAPLPHQEARGHPISSLRIMTQSPHASMPSRVDPSFFAPYSISGPEPLPVAPRRPSHIFPLNAEGTDARLGKRDADQLQTEMRKLS
jgi:hypothetical protein